MSIPLAALGFTMTIAQVLLMRELVATFYGNELLFGLVLATWLAWVVGALKLESLSVLDFNPCAVMITPATISASPIQLNHRTGSLNTSHE